MLLNGPEHLTEALALADMDLLQPGIDAVLEGVGCQSQCMFDIGTDGNLVPADIPLPGRQIRAFQCKSVQCHLAGHHARPRITGTECELRDRESEQDNQQHEAGCHRRYDDFAG